MEFIRNIKITDLASCGKSESFLQSSEWGQFKSRFGWTSLAFIVDWNGFGERPLLVLSRRLAPGFSFAYIPWGPELPESFTADDIQRSLVLAELARGLRRLLPVNCAFIRFDPPWFVEEPLLRLPFKKAAADIQPPDTVLVDLTVIDILASMKPKWRYNIGIAEKRGVLVNRPDASGIDDFYNLLKETAARDGIAIHSAVYYKTLFEIYNGNNSGSLRLYTTKYNNEVLAAIIVLCREKQATYLYGASSNINRNVMAPYALQWRAMQEAKACGCEVYDLFGIPPNEDPNHPMAGLYRFKTGFGGKIVHRAGSWDYPYKPVFYSLFRTLELARKKIRDKKKRAPEREQ